MGYLKNIARPQAGGKLGGILNLKVIRASDVASIATPLNGVIYGDINLKPTALVYEWMVGYQSAGIKTSSKPTREGASKDSALEFDIPNDSEDVFGMLATAERDEFIVLFNYPNGKTKTFGLPKAPVLFRFDHQSGNSAKNKNGYACQFYYSGPENSFFYDGSIPAPPAGPAPNIVRFNGVAIASLAPGESLNIESEYSFTQYFMTT